MAKTVRIVQDFILDIFCFKGANYKLGKCITIIGLLFLLCVKVFKVFISKDNVRKFVAEDLKDIATLDC